MESMEIRGLGLKPSGAAGTEKAGTPDAAAVVGAQDITVPECANTFAHGSPGKKVIAAKVLLPYVQGEVQMLEELLHQAQGKNGKAPVSGRDLFSELLHTLVEHRDLPEAYYLAEFLLSCTQYDAQWGDDDEWNSLVLEVISFLCEKRAPQAIEKACAMQGPGRTTDALLVLRRRLEGEKTAPSPDELAGALQAGKEWITYFLDMIGVSQSSPTLLAVNNRCFCVGCEGKPPLATPVLCTHCRDIGYCSQAHLAADSSRHAIWCYSAESAVERTPVEGLCRRRFGRGFLLFGAASALALALLLRSLVGKSRSTAT